MKYYLELPLNMYKEALILANDKFPIYLKRMILNAEDVKEINDLIAKYRKNEKDSRTKVNKISSNGANASG